MKIIAVSNRKGGTAKTTTAAALAVLLARDGTPVHLVDFDPQASLTRAFGVSDETDGLYHALTDRAGLPVQTVSRNVTLTPSTIELGRAETHSLRIVQGFSAAVRKRKLPSRPGPRPRAGEGR